MTDYSVKLDELKKIRANFKKQNKLVVFTNGCFDILHAGHVDYLSKAKALGDILIVGMNTDNSVKRLKGIKAELRSAATKGKASFAATKAHSNAAATKANEKIQSWLAHSSWANTYNLRKQIFGEPQWGEPQWDEPRWGEAPMGQAAYG